MTGPPGAGGEAPPGRARGLRRAASFVLTGLAGTLLLAMMALTTVDVAGRYLFAAPVDGAFEATEVMLALLVFAGLPIVTARREHVRVGLLADRVPPAARRLLRALSDLLVLFGLLVAAWLLWEKGADLSRWGDRTIILALPLGPVAYGLAVFSALAAAVAAVHFAGSAGRLAGRRRER